MSIKTKRIIYPVKLFIGVLINNMNLKEILEKELEALYGEIDFITPLREFKETDYYKKEMGDLYRYWIFFKKLINKEELPTIKNQTNELEIKFANINGNRTINLDPGYITPAKVVLASTKNYTHRIYIGQNIFAEVTLYFQNKKFNPWPWTYPDYKNEDTIKLFTEVRNKYVKQLFNN